MKIYRISHDGDKYQYFLPVDVSSARKQLEFYPAAPKSAGWVPPAVYVHKPKLIRGNFLDFVGNSSFICDQKAVDELRDLLEPCGELLPLPHEGETFHIVNVLKCVDALDRARAEPYVRNSEFKYGGVRRFAFHAERVPDTPLFKVPESGCILTPVRINDSAAEFKPRVERLRLTGLVFREVWSDEE